MKKLIIHADDFGLTRGVNEGIILGIQKGSISSTSTLVNFPTSQEALVMAKESAIDIGWHINLTLGKPLSDPKHIPSLVTSEGYFHPVKNLIVRSFLSKIKKEDVERELIAQYEVFTKNNIQISHADGHQHVHVLPVVRDVVKNLFRNKISFIRIPRESGGWTIPRWTTRTFFNLLTTNLDFETSSVPFHGFSLGNKTHDLQAWRSLLDRIDKPVSEVMVHPAKKYADDDYFGDDFFGDREEELKLLMSPEFSELLQEKGFRIGSF